MNKTNIARAFLVVPIVLLITYLVSLPVYYFAVNWHDGQYVFCIENGYVAASAAAGFFGLRPLNGIIRDDGSGDSYLLCSLVLVIMILVIFRGEEMYSILLADLLYPDSVRYQQGSDFRNGLTSESFAALMKFSSIYICTYTASFCMSFAMFCRTKWNRYVPELLAAVRRRFFAEARKDDTGSFGAENGAYAAGQNSGEKSEETIRRNMREQLYAEFEVSPQRKKIRKVPAVNQNTEFGPERGIKPETGSPSAKRRTSRRFSCRRSKTG